MGTAGSNLVHSSLPTLSGIPWILQQAFDALTAKSGLHYPQATKIEKPANSIPTVNALSERADISNGTLIIYHFAQIALSVKKVHQQSSRSRKTKNRPQLTQTSTLPPNETKL